MSLTRCLALLVAAASMLSLASAANADPGESVYTQPDGSLTPPICMFGDEYYNYQTECESGYTVIKDVQKYRVYAKKQNGILISSGVRVGKGDPKKLGIKQHEKVRCSAQSLFSHLSITCMWI